MKKRHLFVAVTMLAVGLVFAGCDLLDPGGGTTDDGSNETLPITISGTAEGKSVITEFTVKKDVMKPQKDDKYRILYDNNPVSSGKIDVTGNTTQTITFIPTSGVQFEATLDTAILTFPKGIPTSTGTIMGYRSEGSSNPIPPEFETPLDTKSIMLAVGQSETLSVKAKYNNGGAPYYQWYRNTNNNNTNGTAIVGATGASYDVLPTTAGTFYYYVRVGNGSGGVISSNPKEVKVVASSEIIVGNGSGETPWPNLKGEIIKLLNANTQNMAYTVNFAIDLPYPIVIDKEEFRGTGKLTIKSSVPFTKGIYVTRSNVELNGLDITIDKPDNAAKYLNEKQLCAVLISDRYYYDTLHGPTLATYLDYKTYLTSAIKNVSIVDCNIVFRADYPEVITGICVDPYTAGRASDTRIKITNTIVDVYNTDGAKAQCFMGNNTDFTNDTFTSTGKVAYIPFHLKLIAYGDSSATNTVNFSNNKFTSFADDNLVFEVDINVAAGTSHYQDCKGDLEAIKSTCVTFGTPDHKFRDLAPKYRRLIEILFAQIPSPDKMEIKMVDSYADSYTPIVSQEVFYRMDGEDIERQ